jgi:hypothetical protein
MAGAPVMACAPLILIDARAAVAGRYPDVTVEYFLGIGRQVIDREGRSLRGLSVPWGVECVL